MTAGQSAVDLLRVSREGATRVFEICLQRVDVAVAEQLKTALRAEAAGEPCDILLDMRQIDFIDSSGLGAILALRKSLDPSRIITMRHTRPFVQKVLRLTHLDKVFGQVP
ncbi:MAG: STAS domain-containing protein [Pikeienuella sp.]